jgi:hypothetical protein
MPAIRLLVFAPVPESSAIRLATAAVGGVALSVDVHQDVGEVVGRLRPDAVVLADGGAVRDPLESVLRIRAAAPTHTPIVFVGDGRAAATVERFVEAVFPRPADATLLVARAVALTVGAPPSPRPAALPASAHLQRIAASVDEVLEAALARALHAPDEAQPAAARAEAPSLPEALHTLWSDLLAPDGADGDGTGGAARSNGTAAPEEAGDLADGELPLLLGRFFVEGFTGRLAVQVPAGEIGVFFEAGRPVLAATSDPADRMIEILLRKGRVTPAQHRMARQAARQSDRRMGALLADLGVIKPDEILPVVREHMEELVLSLFARAAGSWRVQRGVMAGPGEIRLLRHPVALVRAGLRTGSFVERIRERLGSSRNVFSLSSVAGPGRAAEAFAELAADEQERRVLLAFDGVRPLDEVLRLAGLPEAAVEELAFTAWAFALLRPAISVPPAGEARFTARDRRIERERVLARHALALEGDYFEVLGVPRRASTEEIRRAHDLVAGALSPAVLGTELCQALSAELVTLREVLDEALRVLGTSALRAQYQACLPAAGPGPGAA